MKFALLHHTIVKEFLLALCKGHVHKLTVVVLNKARKQRERIKASYKTPLTQLVNFLGTHGCHIHDREQSNIELLSPLAAVSQKSTFNSSSC